MQVPNKPYRKLTAHIPRDLGAALARLLIAYGLPTMLEKLHRLRQMSHAELAHRLRERWRKETDRLRFYGGRTGEEYKFDRLTEPHGKSLKQYFLERASFRFYPSVNDKDETLSLITEQFPEWMNRTIGEAGRLVEHRLNILGHNDVALETDIDWHRDPVSGFRWGRQYCADYCLVDRARADAKIVHELNRHQHLPRLAKAFFLTGDETYAQEAVKQIESWIEQNPKWDGINWQSSLEIAIRSTSWLWTIFFLLRSQSLDEIILRRICKSLFAQLDHVHRYPSVYTSPNTHVIGEATALFIAGCLFRELPQAGAWLQFATATLIREMGRQVSKEGVYSEASTYYHCYAADFYLEVLSLARWNRISLPEWTWKRLEQMLELVMHISRPDGSIPLIGDDDGGRALALSLEDYRCFRDGLSSGAVLFGRADFKYQARSFSEESLWLLSAGAWRIFGAVPAQAPAELGRSYPDSGYFIQHSGWNPEDTHVVFDCGGLGRPTHAHAHADALSFTLFSQGRDILIDPATFVYNAANEWRNYFRSTRAHNTVVVDGKNQSEPGASFSWKREARVHLHNTFRLTDVEYVDGEHGGYRALRNPITHRRRLFHVRPDYWIVLDELRGTGTHQFEFLYHFAADTELVIVEDEPKGGVDCRARIGDAGLQLFMYGSEPIRAEAICGQTKPIQGWASARYGERHPSPVLRNWMKGPAPASMMTFLIPSKAPVHSRRLNSNTRHALAAVVRNGDYDDVAVTSVQDGDLHLVDCVMRGEFFWMRMENGNLRRLLAVNAHSFSYAGETVFESEQPIVYIQAHFWDSGIVIERGDHEGKIYVRDLRDIQFQRH